MAGKNILLVEGKDDEHVLKHLCDKRNLGWIDEIEPKGSVEALLESIPVRLKTSLGKDNRVGVVIDADTDLAARWQSLRDRVTGLGYRLPEQPDPTGTVLAPPADTFLPRVGIWIMPDNRTPGILEDFLAFLVPPDSPLCAHVRASVEAIPQGERRFKDPDKPKAIIHTWLAWQKEPGKPLGTAITARFLDPNLPQADGLVAWLKRLYAWD